MHDKVVYVRQMPQCNRHFIHPDKQIGKLRLNLYGTKSAGHIYYRDLRTFLTNHGSNRSKAEPGLYMKYTKKGLAYMEIATDGSLVSAVTEKDMQDIIKILQTKYNFNDLGDPTA